MLSLNFTFRGKGFIGVNAEWRDGVYNFVSVYSPCNTNDKRGLWSSLISKNSIIGWGIGLLEVTLTPF